MPFRQYLLLPGLLICSFFAPAYAQVTAPLPDTVQMSLRQMPEESHDSVYRKWGKHYYSFYSETDMQKALYCYLAALAIAQKYKHEKMIDLSYFDIASVYDALNRFDKAIEYYTLVHKAELKEDLPWKTVRSAYNLAVVYNKAKDSAHAYQYAMIMAYNLARISDSSYVRHNRLLIANILSQIGRNEEFQFYYELLPADAVFIDEELAYGRLYAEATTNYLLLHGKRVDAIEPLWTELSRTRDTVPLLSLIVDKLERLGEYEKAFQAMKLLEKTNLRKSDANSRRDMQSRLLHADNEFKEQKNRLLQNKQQELRDQRLLLAATSIILAIALFLLWLNLKKTRGQRRQLQRNNVEIAGQRDNIQTLLREVHHRVKNNLQVINSLLELQHLKPNNNLRDTGREIQVKLRSIALAHQMMYEQDSVSILPVQEYMEQLVRAVLSIYDPVGQAVKFTVKTSCSSLSLDKVISLALIVDELLINSIKHVVLLKPDCNIDIRCIEENGKIQFSYSDDGPGLPGAPKTSGLGRRLVKSLARQLGGILEVENKPGLLRYIIIFKP